MLPLIASASPPPWGARVRQCSTVLDARCRRPTPGILPVQFTLRQQWAPVHDHAGIRAYTLTYDAQLEPGLGHRPVGPDHLPSPMTQWASRPPSRLPDGSQIQAAYDANGNVTAITPPGEPAHSLRLHPAELAADIHTAGAANRRYADRLSSTTPTNRSAEIDQPDGTVINISYDSGGRLTTVGMPRGTTSTAMTRSARVSPVTTPDDGVTRYDYDGTLLTDDFRHRCGRRDDQLRLRQPVPGQQRER